MNRCYPEIPMGVAIYCWLAGLADACTGLLLIAAPELTLRLMSVETLPKEPVYLHYIEALPYRAIADTLGVGIGTVSRRLADAHARLRRQLGGES